MMRVSGCNRVPVPPARMTPFTRGSLGHRLPAPRWRRAAPPVHHHGVGQRRARRWRPRGRSCGRTPPRTPARRRGRPTRSRPPGRSARRWRGGWLSRSSAGPWRRAPRSRGPSHRGRSGRSPGARPPTRGRRRWRRRRASTAPPGSAPGARRPAPAGPTAARAPPRRGRTPGPIRCRTCPTGRARRRRGTRRRACRPGPPGCRPGPRSRRWSRCGAVPVRRGEPGESGPSPEAWARRWRTVHPSGPAGSSSASVPSSTATRTARATSSLVTEAQAKRRPRSPTVGHHRGGGAVTAAHAGRGAPPRRQCRTPVERAGGGNSALRPGPRPTRSSRRAGARSPSCRRGSGRWCRRSGRVLGALKAARGP